MPIILPEQLQFDPFHESGIVITRSPNRISMELPRDYFGNIPAFIIAVIFIAIGCTMSLVCLWHGQWGAAAFFLLFSVIGGGIPMSAGLYLASFRATLDITPDDLVITHLGWRKDAVPIRISWHEITAIDIAIPPHDPADRLRGLLFHLHDKPPQLTLSGRPIGELERLRGLFKSFISGNHHIL